MNCIILKEILGWCPAGSVSPYGEKGPLNGVTIKILYGVDV